MNKNTNTTIMAAIPFMVAYAGGLAYNLSTLTIVAAASLLIILVRATL